MANITITVKGLTGRQIDITLDDGTQLDAVPALIRAQEEESASLTDAMYGNSWLRHRYVFDMQGRCRRNIRSPSNTKTRNCIC